jgi:hypothetical protein
MLALSALNPTEWWLKLRSNTLRVGPACLRAAIDVIAHHDGLLGLARSKVTEGPEPKVTF